MPRYLGQHFLNNPQIITQIIESAHISPSDTVLEIGPGEGILTQALSQKAKNIIAIELDEKLRETLETNLSSQKNIEIVYGDILKINLPLLLKDRRIKKYKLIANIPYYITAKIIRLFLESPSVPTEMVLMIQKEVAERIVAPAGKMSKLAVSVQYYAQAEILFEVKKENFDPIPQVDSAVIKISKIKKTDKVIDKKFFRIIKAGFCARRKTLVNNLSNSLHLNKDEIEKNILALSKPLTTRAQELSIADWKNLVNLFEKTNL